MKGEKMVKRTSLGGIRKRLSDITNLHHQYKSPTKEKDNAVPAFDVSSTTNNTDQLLKENAAMLKTIQEKDKVIESAEMERQQLRAIVEKTKLQNWQLAQSNSQMLAELNMSKDMLKALQHELTCRDSLFKAKIFELEGIIKMQHQANELQEEAKMQFQTNTVQMKEMEIEPMKEAVDHPLLENNNKGKVTKTKKRPPARSRSIGATTSQPAADKVMAENKRRCLRRQSVRLKQHQQEPQVDLFEVDVANFPMHHHQPIDEPRNKSNPEKGGIKDRFLQSPKVPGTQRSSLGRPLRKTAGNAQSYKEPSGIQKKRRPE